MNWKRLFYKIKTNFLAIAAIIIGISLNITIWYCIVNLHAQNASAMKNIEIKTKEINKSLEKLNNTVRSKINDT